VRRATQAQRVDMVESGVGDPGKGHRESRTP
jgi:hypothetical protein